MENFWPTLAELGISHDLHLFMDQQVKLFASANVNRLLPTSPGSIVWNGRNDPNTNSLLALHFLVE